MVQGKWFAPGSDLSDLLPVRAAVFGRGEDDLDSVSWNAVIYENSIPVATGRIWWDKGDFWIGDIGVLENHRKKHLGDLVLRLLLFKAQSHAAKEVHLRCTRSLTGFFDRLGLQIQSTDDPVYVEMMIPGDQIDLDTCKKCPKSACPNRK